MADKKKKCVEEIRGLVEELNTSRNKEEAVEKLEQTMEKFWEVLETFQGTDFYTAKGLQYQYTIKGGEMFVSRREKTITKATIILAVKKAIALQIEGKAVDGPKKLGVYGASYIWPVFKEIGVISD